MCQYWMEDENKVFGRVIMYSLLTNKILHMYLVSRVYKYAIYLSAAARSEQITFVKKNVIILKRVLRNVLSCLRLALLN